MSNTVSRVLYQTIIYLDLMLPPGSSNLPGTRRATVLFLFGLASDGVYSCRLCYQRRGELLPHLFTLTIQQPLYKQRDIKLATLQSSGVCDPRAVAKCKQACVWLVAYARIKEWRLFSVALAWESPPPDVIRHPAL